MNYKEAFSSIMERKEDEYAFSELNYELKSNMNFIKKVPTLVALIASILCNDSFEVKNCIYYTC